MHSYQAGLSAGWIFLFIYSLAVNCSRQLADCVMSDIWGYTVISSLVLVFVCCLFQIYALCNVIGDIKVCTIVWRILVV